MPVRRTLDQMPIPEQGRVTDIPVVPVSSARSRISGGIAGSLLAFSGRIQDDLDRQAAFDQANAGRAAGVRDDLELKDTSTISGRAFNQAAAQSYVLSLESRSRERVRDLYPDFYNRPADLKVLLDKYRDGVAGKLGEVAPEAVDAYRSNFDAWTQPWVNRALTNAQADAMATATEDLAVLKSQAASDLDAVAPDLFSADPKHSADAMNAMVANLETVRATIREANSQGAQIDEGAALDRYTRRVMSSGVKGWFQRSDDKAGDYLKWRSKGLDIVIADQDGPKTVNVKSAMTPDELAQIDRWFMQEFKLHNQTFEQAGRDMVKAEADERNISELKLWNRIYGAADARPTPSEIVSMADSRMIDPQQAKEMLSSLAGGGGGSDDADVIVRMEDTMAQGHDIRGWINQAYKDSRITAKTAGRLLKENAAEQRRDDADGPEQERKRYRDHLKSAIMTKGPMADVLGGQNERIARALMEYDDMMKTNIAPRDAFEDIFSRAKIGLEGVGIAENLVLPRFSVGNRVSLDIKATAQQLKAARESGRISEREYDEQLKLLDQWDAVMQMNEERRKQQQSKKK